MVSVIDFLPVFVVVGIIIFVSLVATCVISCYKHVQTPYRDCCPKNEIEEEKEPFEEEPEEELEPEEQEPRDWGFVPPFMPLEKKPRFDLPIEKQVEPSIPIAVPPPPPPPPPVTTPPPPAAPKYKPIEITIELPPGQTEVDGLKFDETVMRPTKTT